MTETIRWLMESPEPWTRYRTLVDTLDRPGDDPDVQAARREMLAHPKVRALIDEGACWPGYAVTRHNDARHPIYRISTLADFGLQANDPGMGEIIEKIMAHQSTQGAFQTLANYPTTFGGSGQDEWLWALCDAPTLLYSLLAFGLTNDERVQRAVEHLSSLATEVGWGCAAAPEVGKFKGPGRRGDPCPIANVYALKALSLVPEAANSPAVQASINMLLNHWGLRGEKKYFLFGVGTDFQKLKYPYIWYDILHVVEVLSRFPIARQDPRLGEMAKSIAMQADADGRFTATSMYQAWKGWSFADKKNPSPWLTFLARRMLRRMGSIIAG